jgi:hypothetical protein
MRQPGKQKFHDEDSDKYRAENERNGQPTLVASTAKKARVAFFHFHGKP